MVDSTLVATKYKQQRHGCALAELFVLMVDCVGFGKGASGVDIE